MELETLTGVGSLLDLTSASWLDALPPQHLLRREAAYCPACFADDLAQSEPYERLAWMMREVEVCPIHAVELLTRCTRCLRPRYPLGSLSRPGYCGRCGAWLGSPRSKPRQDIPNGPWRFRMASLVEDALGRREGPAPNAHSVRNSLTIIIESGFGGNRAQFARTIGVAPPTVQAWMSGSRPTLRILLHVAAVMGSDLTSILEGMPSPDVHPRITLADDIRPERHQAVDWTRIEKSLALESVDPRPKSMKVFIREHGLDRTHVRRRELPEAHELIESARLYREAKARNRQDELVHSVELAAESLKARGLAASRRNMERELAPSVLRERALQEAWKRVR